MLEALREKLRQGDLGTLPFVVQNLLAVLTDPRASSRDLKRVIETDQALSVKVLRLANSAYYGFSQKISDLQLAVTLIGFNPLRRMVMSTTSYDIFFRHGGMTFDRQTLWSHCLKVACCSRVLARKHRSVSGEIMFVGGILHEVGYTLLDQHAHPLFVELLATAGTEGRSLVEVERSLLGISHAEVGEWAAEAWNLPPILRAAIRYHHEPLQAGDFILPASIVGMADVLCHDIYTTEEEDLARLNSLAEFLRLRSSDFKNILRDTAVEVNRVNAFMGLGGEEEKDSTQPGWERSNQVLVC